jgi:hypothetical protein
MALTSATIASESKKTERELLRVIRSIARESTWRIERAFELAYCSCGSKREEVERLEKERDEQTRVALQRIQSAIGRRIEELRAEIREIDSREHGHIDAIALGAAPFFSLWMLDSLANGELEFLEEDPAARAGMFASAWLKGWRPRYPT